MEWLCTLWGGQYSLIVPTDGQTIAEPFLDLLEAFDPDYITVYQRSGRDLEDSITKGSSSRRPAFEPN